jgi:hypothetical protein
LSERFLVWSPEILDKMTAKGFRVSHAICLWVLQHVFDPQGVVRLIDRTMHPDAMLYVLNQRTRCVPTNLGYVNDGFDVAGALRKQFVEVSVLSLPLNATTSLIAQVSDIFVLRKQTNPDADTDALRAVR